MDNKQYLLNSVKRIIFIWNNLDQICIDSKAQCRMRQCLKRFFKEVYHKCLKSMLPISEQIKIAVVYKSKFGFNYII